MTLPSEQIPDTLQYEAGRVFADVCEVMGVWPDDPGIVVGASEAIARALMAERQKATEAERERCAKIIDDECDRIWSKQDGRDRTVDTNLRMISAVMRETVRTIRGEGS